MSQHPEMDHFQGHVTIVLCPANKYGDILDESRVTFKVPVKGSLVEIMQRVEEITTVKRQMLRPQEACIFGYPESTTEGRRLLDAYCAGGWDQATEELRKIRKGD